MNGICNGTIFWVPAPWGPGEGPKIIKSELKSQFQRFLNQYLFIFSHMKDIYNISDGIFIRAPGSCPGMGLGGTMGVGGPNFFFFPKFNQIWCVSYLHELHMQRHNFLGPQPLGPWEGVKNLIF